MKKQILLAVIIPLLMSACSAQRSASESSILPSSSDTPSSSETSSSSASESGQKSTSTPASSSSESRSSSNPSSSSSSQAPSSSSSSLAPASSSSSSSSSQEPVSDIFTINLDAILFKDAEGNPIHVSYEFPKSDFSFEHDSTTFNKQLAVASLAFVTTSPFKSEAKATYETFGFDDLYFAEDYDKEETKNTLKYVIGHKKTANYDLVNISLAGFDYVKQWEGNFSIGESGDHSYFKEMATGLVPVVANYLNKYKDATTLKVFFNGYSRSAAIAEIASSLLIDSKLVKEENLYAYLFETPRGVSITNEKEYKSIFNIVNSADVVSRVAPEEYGLKRIGVDIDIYQEKADEILAAFDEELVLGTFTPSPEDANPDSAFKNDVEFVDYIFNYLLLPVDPTSIPDEVPYKDLSTREHYCQYVQEDISYLISFILGLPSEVTDDIMARFKEMDMLSMMGLLAVDGPYNFLKPILDEHSVVYDDTKLKDTLNDVLYLIQIKNQLLLLVVDEKYKANVMRAAYFHALETVIPLLLAYGAEVE